MMTPKYPSHYPLKKSTDKESNPRRLIMNTEKKVDNDKELNPRPLVLKAKLLTIVPYLLDGINYSEMALQK